MSAINSQGCNLSNMAGHRTTFVDLFSGAGGLSLGLEAAGWQCLVGLDYWPEAIKTYKQNFSHACGVEDIMDTTAASIARRTEGDKPDWIVGGPPCQGFSTVGKRQRADQRNQLFREFHRVVKSVSPDGFIIENVRGLKDMAFEEEVANVFREIGYGVQWHVLTAADYGVPQLRRRVVFVGHKTRGQFLGVPASRTPETYTSVADAIADLPELGPGESATAYDREPITEYQKLMRGHSSDIQGHHVSNHPPHLVKAISYIPDGGNRQSIPADLQPKSGFHNSYSRLASWLPAVAVTSNMGKPSATRCIHPFQDRGLTAREGARLQSFPDEFHFVGPLTSQRLQVANAVPPMMAQALAESIDSPSSWR